MNSTIIFLNPILYKRVNNIIKIIKKDSQTEKYIRTGNFNSHVYVKIFNCIDVINDNHTKESIHWTLSVVQNIIRNNTKIKKE